MNSEKSEVAEHVYKGCENMLINLYGRWLDEKEYEDFAEYGKVIADRIIFEFPQVKFVKASKNPFGFTFMAESKTYQVGINSKNYYYKRIR